MVAGKVECSLCRSKKTNVEFGKGGYSYHRCRECKHLFVWPLPTRCESAKHYRQSYQGDYFERMRPWFEHLGKKRADLLETLCGEGKHLSLLDCATGHGLFMAEARRRGWNVTGIESHEESVVFAREELGIEICRGEVGCELKKLSTETFDVITFWHALEHIESPSVILAQISRVLAPGGYLVINSPNLASAIFRLVGRRWSWIYCPGHLQYFSVNPLTTWFEREGWKVLSTETWTNAPNLFFLIEESLLLTIADVLSCLRVFPSSQLATRIRKFVWGTNHQMGIQMATRRIYEMFPRLDRFLRHRHLGHEFYLVVQKGAL